MRYLFLAVCVCFLSGCGESESSKRNRTTSQVEVLAEKLSKEVGEDGWFKQSQPEDVDAWGNKLVVKYKRTGGTETLTVWSNGGDGLPFTRDDISSHSYSVANAEILAEIARLKRENRQASVEGYGYHLTKGLTKGIREGWKDRGKDK